MFHIIELEQTDSTNNYANLLIEQNKVKNNTVVWSQNQINGRGQKGSNWHSEPYKNLTFSLIYLPTNLLIYRQFFMMQAVSLAVCDFIKTFEVEPKIKWPNDIYVINNKICGILIESSCMGNNIYSVVAGIGININQTLFNNNIPNPTSLKLQTNKNYVLNILLNKLLQHLNYRLTELETGNYDNLMENYVKLLYRFNEIHNFKDSAGIFKAKIVGVEETGELILLDQHNIERKYIFKEVGYLI